MRGAAKALPDGRIVGHLFDPARPLARQRVAFVPEDDPAAAASLVLLPMRVGTAVFGLLILASPDASRYQATFGTEFLERLAELASAALARLCKA